MTIQISKPAQVELPAASNVGRKADLPFDFNGLEPGQSIFVTGEDAEKMVRRVHNAARRAHSRKGEVKIDPSTGEPRLSRNGNPIHETVHDKKFTVRHIIDGKDYGKAYAGREGWAFGRLN